MSSLSSTAGSASAASPGPSDAVEAGEWLRTAFGVVLFVAWGLLTFVWVASTVYLVEHGTYTAAITAAGAVAVLLLLGGMEGLEVSVIDRWQTVWPGRTPSYLARWLAARQLFVALIVVTATLLADRSVVVFPGTSLHIKNGFYLSLFDLLWTTLTVLWFAQIFWKHLGATNPDRYLVALKKYLFPIVEVVRKLGISQPGEWTAVFVESQLLWPASIEQLEQGKPDHPLTHGDLWRAIRADRRELRTEHPGLRTEHPGLRTEHPGPADAAGPKPT